MSAEKPIKLLPRNVAALRRGQSAASGARSVAGNPVSTRLESGVGNCFPGLEFDLRNLERRFFPFVEVDVLSDQEIRIAAVDAAGGQKALSTGELSSDEPDIFTLIDADLALGRAWRIVEIEGTFGPLGERRGNRRVIVANLGLPSAGPNRQPPDAYTALRLLTEGTKVAIKVRRGNRTRTISGSRAHYLDDNGVLAQMFLPGELTQSLCSPWTHDFRDCGCQYWASNHPDIALPPLPTPATAQPEINRYVPWERSARSLTTLPPPATINTPEELDHYQINAAWQTLNFVLEGRETLAPYTPGTFKAPPFASKAELVTNLRYAAGVELAVVHEYLAAAFSLRTTGLPAALRDDVTAAHFELMTIAVGEMHHMRRVNNVLRAIDDVLPFVPALRVALQVPGATPGSFRNVQPRAATPTAIADFIEIERPSVSVDGLYSRILATLESMGSDEDEQTIRSIMAEGENHFESFAFIQEWLSAHDQNEYLRNSGATVPPAGNVAHGVLQDRYLAILKQLFDGYAAGVPAGAADINDARTTMIGPLAAAAEAIAAAGFLVAFDPINDPRFTPLAHP